MRSGRGSGQFDVTARAGWTIGLGKVPTAGGQPGTLNMRRLRTAAERDPLGAMSAFDPQARRYRIEFYAQVFNLLNQVNQTGYRGVRTSPFFGKPTAALPPRRIEIGARFDF